MGGIGNEASIRTPVIQFIGDKALQSRRDSTEQRETPNSPIILRPNMKTPFGLIARFIVNSSGEILEATSDAGGRS
ncbi:hypothetical protein [Aquibium sp. ELW1220]|uniref:hypothetical protein n=1 Tax=Aquibium sp. ELW1220 TaxID=2976766 RepID=UPI0025AF474E|nr:hypothetical protein [Aquibium sp. ELW1220]MDN2578749.1 hypothetical protein [Aquibium sp. ELW1220]